MEAGIAMKEQSLGVPRPFSSCPLSLAGGHEWGPTSTSAHGGGPEACALGPVCLLVLTGQRRLLVFRHWVRFQAALLTLKILSTVGCVFLWCPYLTVDSYAGTAGLPKLVVFKAVPSHVHVEHKST